MKHILLLLFLFGCESYPEQRIYTEKVGEFTHNKSKCEIYNVKGAYGKNKNSDYILTKFITCDPPIQGCISGSTVGKFGIP